MISRQNVLRFKMLKFGVLPNARFTAIVQRQKNCYVFRHLLIFFANGELHPQMDSHFEPYNVGRVIANIVYVGVFASLVDSPKHQLITVAQIKYQHPHPSSHLLNIIHS